MKAGENRLKPCRYPGNNSFVHAGPPTDQGAKIIMFLTGIIFKNVASVKFMRHGQKVPLQPMSQQLCLLRSTGYIQSGTGIKVMISQSPRLLPTTISLFTEETF